MVNFLPPLGSHHQIPLSSSSSGKVAITFYADDINSTLRPEDRVEIWTNAPNEDGTEGEWRGIAFEKVPQAEEEGTEGEGVEQEKSTSGKVITFTATSSSTPSTSTPTSSDIPTPTPSSHLRSTTLHLPSQPITFEYTFRILYPDGNIWWLGGEGVNGTVGLVEGEAEGASAKGVRWEEGKVVGGGGLGLRGWQGVGLQVGEGTTPSLVTLPTPSSQPLGFTYLYPPSPLPFSLAYPFSQANTSLSFLPSPSSKLTYGQGEKGLALASSQDGEGEGSAWVEKDGDTGLANLFKDKDSSLIALTSKGSVAGQKTLALTYSPSTSTSTHLLIHSTTPTPKSLHQVGINIPGTLFGPASGENEDGHRIALWSEKIKQAVLLEDNDLTCNIKPDNPATSCQLALEAVKLLKLSGKGFVGAVGAAELVYIGEGKKEEEYEVEEVVKIYPIREAPVQTPAEEEEEEVESEYEDVEVEEEVEIEVDEEEEEDNPEQNKVKSPTGNGEVFSDSEITQTTETDGRAAFLSGSSEVSRTTSHTSVDEVEVEVPAQKGEGGENGEVPSPNTGDLHEVEEQRRQQAGDNTSEAGSADSESAQLIPKSKSKSNSKSATSNSANPNINDIYPQTLSTEKMHPLLRALWIFAGIFQSIWMKAFGVFRELFGLGGGKKPEEERVEEVQEEEGEEEGVAGERTPLLSGATTKVNSSENLTKQNYTNLSFSAIPSVPEPSPAAPAAPKPKAKKMVTRTRVERVKKPKVAKPKAEKPVVQTKEEVEPVDEIITRKLRREVVVPAYLKVVYSSVEAEKVRLLTTLKADLVVKKVEAGEEVDVKVEKVEAEETELRVVEVEVGQAGKGVELKVMFA